MSVSDAIASAVGRVIELIPAFRERRRPRPKLSGRDQQRQQDALRREIEELKK
ncbi:hypothetical protein [Sphingomonas sp.]|uniref:hypothetical protein n=1 Tax=Sphingomonas sp. TaxID=28214 RepID=UPI003BAB8E00